MRGSLITYHRQQHPPPPEPVHYEVTQCAPLNIRVQYMANVFGLSLCKRLCRNV